MFNQTTKETSHEQTHKHTHTYTYTTYTHVPRKPHVPCAARPDRQCTAGAASRPNGYGSPAAITGLHRSADASGQSTAYKPKRGENQCSGRKL